MSRVDRRFQLYKKDDSDSLETRPFEINLRRELEKIILDEKRSKWYIYRRKNMNEVTEGFLEFMNENPYGPDHPYVDEVHRGFRIPQNSISLLKRVTPSLTPGQPFQPFVFFVFMYKSEYHGQTYYLKPKYQDVLFELDYHHDMAPQVLDAVNDTGRTGIVSPPFIAAYNIHNIARYELDDNSRIEYYLLACIENPITSE